MLVAASVVMMFVAFAAALIWGDFQTRPRQLAQASSSKRRPF